MTLDLKHAEAPSVLRRIIAGVDIVVESGLPPALAEHGVSGLARTAAALAQGRSR